MKIADVTTESLFQSSPPARRIRLYHNRKQRCVVVNTVRQDPFGTDHGLVHEVIVTGRKVGAGKEFWARLAHDEELFLRVAKMVNGTMGAPRVHPLIRSASKHFGFRLTSKLTTKLTSQLGPVPYSDEVLAECAETHVLVPYLGLSMAQIHQVHPGLFWSKNEDAWYRQAHQTFAQTKHRPRWYLVQKTVLLVSQRKTWSEQMQLVRKSGVNEVIPAAVLVYALVFHYLQAGEWLLLYQPARTTDVTAEGKRVGVGSFGSDGLNANDWYDYPYPDLGVAVSRKLP